ncbi:hypothetical protein FD755_024382 [Muntiacus reevesi]|uniref:Centrosomal protein of 19 kDa n=1 Tax=Muntiacus reevesi TaxID=9886 RepID=A0A5N3VAK0_MUNRE|nr:hypothetical protein FD755_024382 [Muntiacus reevesi]
MMCTAKKCGIKFQPPAIILIYVNEMKGKNCSRAAEHLKNNPRHKGYLEQVSLIIWQKLDNKELAKRKSIMDELFEKNQEKKDDPNFVYDVEVEFPQDEQLQSCGWDTESAEEF